MLNAYADGESDEYVYISQSGGYPEYYSLGGGYRTFYRRTGLDLSIHGFCQRHDFGAAMRAIPLFRFGVDPSARDNAFYCGVGLGANVYSHKNLDYLGVPEKHIKMVPVLDAEGKDTGEKVPVKDAFGNLVYEETPPQMIHPQIQGTVELVFGKSWAIENGPTCFVQIGSGKAIYKGRSLAPFTYDWRVRLEMGLFLF